MHRTGRPPIGAHFTSTLRALSVSSLILGLGSIACRQNKNETPDAPPEPVATVAARPLPVAEPLPAPPDVSAAPPDAQKTASGLATKILTPGVGIDHPHPGDTMRIRYVGWRKDGVMFDRSGARPADIGFNQTFPGWAEGLKLMVVGEKRRLWIPSALAYGDAPGRSVPAGDLTMDVDLIRISGSSSSGHPSPNAARAPATQPLPQ